MKQKINQLKEDAFTIFNCVDDEVSLEEQTEKVGNVMKTLKEYEELAGSLEKQKMSLVQSYNTLPM